MRDLNPYNEGFDALKDIVIAFNTRFVVFAKEHKSYFDGLCDTFNDKTLKVDDIELDDEQEIFTIIRILEAHQRSERSNRTTKNAASVARDNQLQLMDRESRQIHIAALHICIKENKKRIKKANAILTKPRKFLLKQLKSSVVNQSLVLIEQCNREYEQENHFHQLKIMTLAT